MGLFKGLNKNNNMTDKKLFFELSDGADVSKIVMELDGCMEWIKNDIIEDGLDIKSYTIEPIWLTDEEFNNLPEAEI